MLTDVDVKRGRHLIAELLSIQSNNVDSQIKIRFTLAGDWNIWTLYLQLGDSPSFIACRTGVILFWRFSGQWSRARSVARDSCSAIASSVHACLCSSEKRKRLFYKLLVLRDLPLWRGD